jgi:transcriptional regulator with XRE-family HTH domain
MSIEQYIGRRLAEERERLYLNQGLFAGKVGVSRMSQVNYESGKRFPDARYLLAASEAGVDVAYVVTGKRAQAPNFYRMATVFVLESIELRTGFSENVLSFVIEALSDAATSSWIADSPEISSNPDAELAIDLWIEQSQLDGMIAALFENARLLRDIFGAVNARMNTSITGGEALRIPGDKRAAMVLMLYRAFKASGEIDYGVIDEAVRLAAT